MVGENKMKNTAVQENNHKKYKIILKYIKKGEAN